MATVPTFRTWVAGEVVTASEMNTNVRDGGNFFLSRPICQVFNNAGVTCSNGTATLIPWDTELEDNDGMHSTSTNPSRVICQTLGLFNLAWSIRWFSVASVTNRTINMRLNAAGASGGGTSLSTRVDSSNNGSATFSERSGILYRFVNIGDYLEVFGTQNSGGALGTDVGARVTMFTALWLLA